ncbi:MAG: hypothetical protein PHR16_17815 [Methylovulum sp.]|nr:hypothetical protein [Methylovulum sp.]
MSFQEDFAIYMLFADKINELRDTSNAVLRAQNYDARLKTELDSALRTLDNIYGRINDSIVETREDAEKRGMRLLSSICTQYDLHIQQAINYENNRFGFAVLQYEEEAEKLRLLGYDHEKIQQILKDTPKPDIELHRRKIAVITAESQKVSRFMGDYPRYNMALLEGTRFEGWTLETNKFVNPNTSDRKANYYQDDSLIAVTHCREIEWDSYGLIAKALGETQQPETAEV